MNKPGAIKAQFGPVILLALLLCWGAFFNGHPLMFPDSGPYIHGAAGMSIALDRSPYYGLFGALFFMGREFTWALWLWAIAQAAILALSLNLLALRILPDWSWPHRLLLLLPLIFLSGLPWHATQLMPDALAGACAILALVVLDRPWRETGTPLLLALLLAVTLVHNTHLFITAAAAAALLLVAMLARRGRGVMIGIAMRTALLLGAAASLAILFNGLAHDRWRFAPMGPHFVFASLQQEGLTADWLDRHCGVDGPARLCAMKDNIGTDSQEILWGDDNPVHRAVYRTGSSPFPMVDEMDRAAKGAIAEAPLALVRIAFRDGALQLVRFAPLDDQCPHICTLEDNVLDIWLRDIEPQLMDNFLAQARQADGSIPKELVASIVVPFTWLGLLALLPMLVWAFIRRDRLSLELLLGTLAVLIVSAVLTGALSEPYDRYQSRIAWLAPMAALLIAGRFFQRRRGGDTLEERSA